MDKRGERSTAYPRGRRARLSAVRLRVHVWMNERNETVKAQSGLRQVMAVKNKKKKKRTNRVASCRSSLTRLRLVRRLSAASQSVAVSPVVATKIESTRWEGENELCMRVCVCAYVHLRCRRGEGQARNRPSTSLPVCKSACMLSCRSANVRQAALHKSNNEIERERVCVCVCALACLCVSMNDKKATTQQE